MAQDSDCTHDDEAVVDTHHTGRLGSNVSQVASATLYFKHCIHIIHISCYICINVTIVIYLSCLYFASTMYMYMFILIKYINLNLTTCTTNLYDINMYSV